VESLSSRRIENANQMREMERQLREASDEASRQQLRDQQATYDRIYERQVEEQDRLWEKERDALNRQEALRAREQAEYQRKLDALELKSRKGKTFFSDAVRGICTAWRLQDWSGLADDQSQDQSGSRCGGLATSTSRDEVLLQCQPQ
jgi:hypothetical protein